MLLARNGADVTTVEHLLLLELVQGHCLLGHAARSVGGWGLGAPLVEGSGRGSLGLELNLVGRAARSLLLVAVLR